MKQTLLFSFLAALAFLFAPSASHAADPASHTYEGAITGVVCISCKQHITETLTEKIQGITEIKVVAGDKEGEQKLTIVSTSDKLTKEAAVKALGDLAESYKILSLEKKS